LQREIKSGIVEEPGAAIIHQTMLHNHWLLSHSRKILTGSSWHSECLENVSIFCGNIMLLILISTSLDLLPESPFVSLWVRIRSLQDILLETIPDLSACIEEVLLKLRMEGPIDDEIGEYGNQSVDDASHASMR
jgi:hypothetical protein